MRFILDLINLMINLKSNCIKICEIYVYHLESMNCGIHKIIINKQKRKEKRERGHTFGDG